MTDEIKTKVVFRRWKRFKRPVIALFPYEINDTKGNILSYGHIGQHGAADYTHVIDNTTKTTEDEYKSLKKELEYYGYNLEVIQKISWDKYKEALKTEKELGREKCKEKGCTGDLRPSPDEIGGIECTICDYWFNKVIN